MVRPLLVVSAAASALALAGCSGETNDNPAAGETTSPAVIKPLPTSTSTAPIAHSIPKTVQGRWGLVPADCTTTRGDDKGLLVVGPDSLKFYESHAKLGAIAERSDTRIRATFAFTGEGMEWTHDVVLEAQDGGKTLVRRAYGPDAEPGPFKYTRC